MIDLKAGDLSLRLGCHGGVILDFRLGDRAIFRPAQPDAAPGCSACFPLVPVGNRIRDNCFVVDDITYRTIPNAPPEPLHLHGAGWLAHWQVQALNAASATLQHHHDGTGLPHVYLAEQHFALTEKALTITLSVTNTGAITLPFGLGWHPFFPDGAVLTAPARGFLGEGPGHLPTDLGPVPSDLDFTTPHPLPQRWINNAFTGWTGLARIDWPACGLSLTIAADPLFGTYHLYRPGEGDHFAFEPMSHPPDALSAPGHGGLVRLAQGETLAGSITLSPHPTGVVSGDPS